MNRMRVARDVLLRKFGLETSATPPVLQRHPEWAFENYLELAVAHHVRRYGTLTFVQVGAFDGLGLDPIRPLVRRYALRGVVAEPDPRAFTALRETYADSPQVVPLNVAVTASDGVRTLFSRADRAIPQASLSRAHLRRHGVRDEELLSHEVRCITLTTLIAEHAIEPVDLLQVDAEGEDYEIIRTLDFGALAPAIIRFEHLHMSDAQRDECACLLAERGYRFITERCDTTALRTDPEEKRADAAAARRGGALP